MSISGFCKKKKKKKVGVCVLPVAAEPVTVHW